MKLLLGNRNPGMKIVVILCSLFCATIILAQTDFTPISNLNQPIGSGGDEDVFSNQIVAISFTTSNTLTTLSAVSVSIVGSNPSGGPFDGSLGAFSVALYSNASGSPGSSLVALFGNNYPTNAGIYTYSNTSALVLMTNTTYWIVGYSSNSTGITGYKWKLTSSASLDSDSIWTLGVCDYDANDNGWKVQSGYYLEFSVTVTTNQPPLLSVAASGNNLVFLWPTNATGFTLQQNPDLTTTNWSAVTNAPTITNNQNQVILTPTNSSCFFRLVAQ
jgi:hypothetical protein